MSDDPVAAYLNGLPGRAPHRRAVARDAVSASAIRTWCDAMDERHAVYLDPAAARAEGQPDVLAPPATLADVDDAGARARTATQRRARPGRRPGRGGQRPPRGVRVPRHAGRQHRSGVLVPAEGWRAPGGRGRLRGHERSQADVPRARLLPHPPHHLQHVRGPNRRAYDHHRPALQAAARGSARRARAAARQPSRSSESGQPTQFSESGRPTTQSRQPIQPIQPTQSPESGQSTQSRESGQPSRTGRPRRRG